MNTLQFSVYTSYHYRCIKLQGRMKILNRFQRYLGARIHRIFCENVGWWWDAMKLFQRFRFKRIQWNVRWWVIKGEDKGHKGNTEKPRPIFTQFIFSKNDRKSLPVTSQNMKVQCMQLMVKSALEVLRYTAEIFIYDKYLRSKRGHNRITKLLTN